MKISLVKTLVLFAVFTAALPVLAIGILVLLMNTQINSIAESEFGKITLSSSRQLVGDTLKIYQIINKAHVEEAENVRVSLFEKFSEWGNAQILDTYCDVDIYNQVNPSERIKLRLYDFSIGSQRLRVKRGEDGGVTGSEGPVKDALEALKADTGWDFAIFLRVNGRGDFLRISNTMCDRNGNEYVGSYLPSDNEITKSILAKKSYSGINHGENVDFIINYYPITDEFGEVIAAVSYGKMQNSIDYIMRYLEGVHIGSGGYMWAIELLRDGESIVRVSRDASIRGMIIEKDMAGDRRALALDIINSATAQGDSVIGVKEFSPEGESSEGVVAAFAYFKPWKMVFGATIYRNDFDIGVERIVAASEHFILLLVPLGIAMLMVAGISAYIAAVRGSEMIGELVRSSRLMERGDIFSAREGLERMIKSNRWSNLEIYDLSVSLLRMSGNLSKLVSKVKVGGVNLADSATVLAEGAAQIELMATKKAVALRKVSVTIGSMTNSVRLLKNGANSAAKKLDDTVSILSNGAKLLKMLDENARELLEATESASSKLALIKDKTDSISDSISAINSISERINMLSLNAAVEAEKAGEYGEGFASVSEEIKKLSDAIALSGRSISRIVSGMGGYVESGVRDISKFADKMADNVSLIGKVSSTLGAVESQVSNIGPEFEALAVGVEEEAEFAVQISRTIRDMSVSALQTRNEIVELKQAADFIDDSSEDLKSKMAHFNLGD